MLQRLTHNSNLTYISSVFNISIRRFSNKNKLYYISSEYDTSMEWLFIKKTSYHAFVHCISQTCGIGVRRLSMKMRYWVEVIATKLLPWVVITIWLTVTKYPYLKWICSFLPIFFFFLLSPTKLVSDLTIYVSNSMVYIKKQELFTFPEHMVSPPFLVGSVLFIFSLQFSILLFLFCLSSSCVLCAQCCQCLWILHSWLPFQFVMLCLLFSLSLSCVLCTQCYQCLWIVHSWLPFQFSLTFIIFIRSIG